MKKKLLFVLNHFEYSNGVSSALKSMLLNFDYETYSVDVLPLYRFNKDFAKELNGKVSFLQGLGFYFRGLDKIMSFFTLKSLFKKFIKQDYDLVIAYQFGLPTRLLSIFKGPKICWIHTYDEGLTLRPFYEEYDKIITVSKVGMEKLIRDGIQPEKCSFCYNIIDEELIIEKSLEPCPIKKNKDISFVTVARMDPDKGYLRLIESIKMIKNTIEGIEFWFVGNGSDYKKAKRAISKYGLSDSIKLCGKQNNPFSIMKNADIYLCASYREGFSTSCQEAAILGLPIMSVEVDGSGELKEITNSGAVFENSLNGLADNISFVAQNHDLLKNWSEQSKKNSKLFYKSVRIQNLLREFGALVNIKEREVEK